MFTKQTPYEGRPRLLSMIMLLSLIGAAVLGNSGCDIWRGEEMQRVLSSYTMTASASEVEVGEPVTLNIMQHCLLRLRAVILIGVSPILVSQNHSCFTQI